jgi:hypothetical protein
VPQLGRGEKNEGVDATVVAGGDLVGDVVKTSSHILHSPASTTQGEIAFDKQHMMSLPRQGRERSIVVVVSSSSGVIRTGSSQGERRLETPCGATSESSSPSISSTPAAPSRPGSTPERRGRLLVGLQHERGGQTFVLRSPNENKLTRTTAGQPVLWT